MATPKQRSDDTPPAGCRWIFTPYITRNGRKLWAHQYGLKAWRFPVRLDRDDES